MKDTGGWAADLPEWEADIQQNGKQNFLNGILIQKAGKWMNKTGLTAIQ
jgi:hypothetical protein